MEIKTPVSATLSPEQISAIQDTVSHYQAVKGGVMPALHAVQGICGNWLPLEALKLMSEGMDIPYPYLYGVMSFYTMFSPTPRGKYIIRLCESPPCHIMGADNLVEVLKAELGIKVGETTTDGLFTLEHTACLGVCEVSPAMQINEVVFGRLTAERVKNILSDYRAGKTVDYRTLPRTTNPLSDYLASGDELVLLANVDQIDPLSLDAYLERGGYEGLKKALSMTPEEVVNTVKDSGLRGRGGAGFPTGLKWSFTRPSPITPKYIVCNADEGEPGTIKDRYIMEGDPHRVLEGMAIAGYAVGASVGYIYCRGEYYLSMYRLQQGHRGRRGQGSLGRQHPGHRLLLPYPGSDRRRLLCLRRGNRAHRVHPGRAGQPPGEAALPRPGGRLVQAHHRQQRRVPGQRAGHRRQRLRLVQGQGHRGRQGHQDLPGGGPGQDAPASSRPTWACRCRELIDKIRRRRPRRPQVQDLPTGGARLRVHHWTSIWTPPWNTRPWPRSEGGLGSGTMLVMDDTVCVIDVVKCLLYFFQHESCGFCLPCRRGTRVLYELICKVAAGKGTQADLDRMLTLAQTMVDSANCALGWSPYSFLKTTMERFKDEYDAHLAGNCPLGVCKAEEHSH